MLVDRLDEAIRARREALDLHRAAGDRLREGKAFAVNAAALVRAGRNPEAEEASRRAIAVLRPLPPGPALAYAYRIQANLRMLNRDRAEAVRWGQQGHRAGRAPRRAGDRRGRLQHDRRGRCSVYGDDRGRVHLEKSLALAREAGLPEWIASAFLNLGSACGEVYRFADADRYLTEGIRYAAERDLDYGQHYMQAWLALTRLYQGRWAEAGDAARPLVDNPHVAAISRIMALVALGRLRTRRGDPGAAAVLDEALELAERTQTLQRLGPVRAARAEAAWLAGDRPRAARRGPRRVGPGASTTGTPGTPASSASGAGAPASASGCPRTPRARSRFRSPATGGAPPPRGSASAVPTSGPARWPTATRPPSSPALEIFDRLGARPDLERLRQRLRAERRAPHPARPAPEHARQPVRPDRARGRDHRPARAGADQRPHRRAPAHLAQDRGPSRLGHPGQAGRRYPRGGGPPGRCSTG